MCPGHSAASSRTNWSGRTACRSTRNGWGTWRWTARNWTARWSSSAAWWPRANGSSSNSRIRTYGGEIWPSPIANWATPAGLAGSTDRAVACYRQSLPHFEQLAARLPDDVGRRNDLRKAHHRLACALRDAGDEPAALAAFQAALVLARELADREPHLPDWRRIVAAHSWDLAEAHLACRQPAETVQAFQASMQSYAQVAARHVAAREGLASLQERLWDLARDLNRAGQSALAGELASVAVAAGERLLAADPARVDWQNDLSLSWSVRAEVLRSAGAAAEALEAFAHAADLIAPLLQQDSPDELWQANLAHYRGTHGDVLVDLGRPGEALEDYQACANLRRSWRNATRRIGPRWTTSRPSNTPWPVSVCGYLARRRPPSTMPPPSPRGSS